MALCTSAITGRRYRFKVNEPFAGMLAQATAYAHRVKEILRRSSDLRFGVAARESEGMVELGYRYRGEMYVVAMIPRGGDPTAARARVVAELAQHRDRAFPEYPGVRALLGFIESLEGVAVVETAVAAMTDRGSLWRPVVPDGVMGKVHRFRLLAR